MGALMMNKNFLIFLNLELLTSNIYNYVHDFLNEVAKVSHNSKINKGVRKI